MVYRVRRAGLVDAQQIGELFNQYRMFYNQVSDTERAVKYIQERLSKDESVIWMAESDSKTEPGLGNIAGFVQLYPSFSSVSMGSIWVLNDLYVHKDHRKKGIARKLMHAAQTFASETGAIRITLSTAINNTKAQALYESEGYAKDDHFLYYERNVD
ncbi:MULTISPECIES: GNAT family N-acetyltransferase [unclassified Paenibacillus]|uniref:GNAT family N-acetyltransferase n=1 Tax=unclassified Paenibacillus TaxID=185978 RepID=UPI000BA529D7|nr:GNAT family N-acetyltransferase [Paenibacillus sp. 7523-1]MBM6382628.1 GNAT family N-acetyltransferase [Paenibacillus sp.]PAD31995.1 GNAT family N-acetyltransferase [Paenibacillus sp. 7523-1]